MKEIILRTKIKREYGYLYPTGADEDGLLIVYKIKAGRHKKVLPEGSEMTQTPILKPDYKETTEFKPNEKEHLDLKISEKEIIDWDE